MNNRQKYRIIILSFLCIPMVVLAQKNRYGMTISTNTTGECSIERRVEVEKLIDLSKLTDLCVKYKYIADKIQPEDYTGCKTSSFVYKDYGTYQLKMEVDIPAKTKGPFPFIIYVHGGGWAGGSLNGFVNQSKYLASRGIAGVRISYTLKKQNGHFEQGMQELEDAFQFVKQHAGEWNLDIDRFGYAGGSAGTPLGALAAMQKENCKLFIGANGIYDFTYTDNTGSFPGKNNSYLKNYNNLEKLKEISPFHQIPKKNPPAVILFHGTADITIPYQQSLLLYDKIKQVGGRAEKRIYPNYMHAFYGMNSSDKYEEITIEMYKFANEILNKKP